MMRCLKKMMDARRGVQQMAIPFASLITLQTPFFETTPSLSFCIHGDNSALDALRCCSPLIWNNQTAWPASSIASNALPSHNCNLPEQAFYAAEV